MYYSCGWNSKFIKYNLKHKIEEKLITQINLPRQNTKNKVHDEKVSENDQRHKVNGGKQDAFNIRNLENRIE